MSTPTLFSPTHREPALSRRDFLLRAGGGFGALALTALLEREARGQTPVADAPGSPLLSNQTLAGLMSR